MTTTGVFTMPEPEVRLDRFEERLRNQEVWAAEHDGEIKEKWRQCHEWQRSKDKEDGYRDRRIGVVERRLIWLIAGVGSGSGLLGAVAGGGLKDLIASIF